ncbi:hypothetical protein FQR65_LT13216 [Abscondita terminalis]|nr:hypothetical protein FQR65_LT13216 [Abscondita terminalis]
MEILPEIGIYLNKKFISSYNLKLVEECETVHIGIVCTRENCNTIDFYTLVKSLYLYRSSPLHYHILADEKSELIISTLFDTWNISRVSVNIYNLKTLPKVFHWMFGDIKTLHLSKLIFPTMIAIETPKLLMIDPNLFCIADVNLFLHFHYDPSAQIKILSSSDKSFSVWILNVPNLKRSNTFQAHIKSGFSEYKNIQDFKLDSLNLQINEEMIDEHITCAVINDSHSVTVDKYVVQNTYSIRDLHYCIRQEFFEVILERNLRKCKAIPQINVVNYKYLTLLYVRNFTFNTDETDVTMVTQMSIDKFPVLEEICRRWTGPISVSLYLKEENLFTTIRYIHQSKELKNRYNIGYHVLFKKGTYQPINVLRNVALKYVNTPYVLLNDVDFIPGLNLYDLIKSQIKNMKTMDKKALVIPAFGTERKDVSIPLDLIHLNELWNKGDIIPFQQNSFPEGHRSTNYTKFNISDQPYTIKYEPNYEPYVVVQSSVPQYDVRYIGYIRNKIQHILELDAAGYEFICLPKSFLVHKYHEKSKDLKNMSLGKYLSCIFAVHRAYIKELNRKYNASYKFISVMGNLHVFY